MFLFRRLLRSPLVGAAPLVPEGRRLCDQRGYCGPFSSPPHLHQLAIWKGFGVCSECGCTVPVPPAAPDALDWAGTGAPLSPS